SLVQRLRTPEQCKAVAAKLGYGIGTYELGVDQPNQDLLLAGYFEALFKLHPGEVMPIKWEARGSGYWITWVDSIAPPAPQTWEVIKPYALAAYREGAGERAMMAKVAEMDSLGARGWSLDSLATLWGGLTRSKELSAVGANQRAGLPASLDSLVFGLNARPPALEKGQESG